jgi:curved DNA-binding protein CbpA
VTLDPSVILGVAPDADAATVRAAYRLRALEHHPDRGGSTAAMAQINAAYAWLCDPARRASGHEATGAGSGRRSPRGSSGAWGPTPPLAREPEEPVGSVPRHGAGRTNLRSTRLVSRPGQWVATLAALAALAMVAFLGGSTAISAVAALLVLRVVADRRPVGVPFWPAVDVQDAVAFAVKHVVRHR